MKHAIANYNSASVSNAYMLDHIKHEIKQAYYKHNEITLIAESQNLALEIYHRSYGFREIEVMKKSSDVFYANTIQFYIDLGGDIRSIRMDLPHALPFPTDHQAVFIELFEEIWVHYEDLTERMKKVRDSAECDEVMEYIDDMAKSQPINYVLNILKLRGTFVSMAIRNIEKLFFTNHGECAITTDIK